jgi:hypothetical protein
MTSLLLAPSLLALSPSKGRGVGFFDTPRSSLTLAKEWPVKALKALKGQKLIMAEGIKGLSVY